MALTKTFPTGDPAGLSIVDTRRVIGSLIVCDTSGNPRLGVIPRNTSPIVTATATLNYAVAAADFVTSRTGVGAELLSNDGTTNVLTTAAPASNARTDVIWVRPQFTASADATNTPVFGVTQGVTSGTVPPPEPSIPAGALKLATAYFPAGATATNSAGVVITQVAPYTATSGGTVLVRTESEFTAWSPATGAVAYNLATGVTYVRRGSVWKGGDVTLTVDPIYDKHVSPFNAVAVCDNGQVKLEGLIRNAALFGANAGVRYVFGSIPVAYAPSRTLRFGTASVLGFAIIEVTTTGELAYWIASSVANVAAGSWNLSISVPPWKVQ